MDPGHVHRCQICLDLCPVHSLSRSRWDYDISWILFCRKIDLSINNSIHTYVSCFSLGSSLGSSACWMCNLLAMTIQFDFVDKNIWDYIWTLFRTIFDIVTLYQLRAPSEQWCDRIQEWSYGWSPPLLFPPGPGWTIINIFIITSFNTDVEMGNCRNDLRKKIKIIVSQFCVFMSEISSRKYYHHFLNGEPVCVAFLK